MAADRPGDDVIDGSATTMSRFYGEDGDDWIAPGSFAGDGWYTGDYVEGAPALTP